MPSPPFERVLVLADFGKNAVRALAAELEPWLRGRVDEVRLERDARAFSQARALAAPGIGPRAEPVPDLVVVLGGDGALLGAVRAFAEDRVPMVGINMGRVGFLASTPATRWRETLEGVLDGHGILERRMRLSVEWERGGATMRNVALNDVVLQRGTHQGMVVTAVHVDDDWLTNFRADGVILATPSGSTAYSLSAGGPILDPAVEGIVVTPICSQGLSNRPIVLRAESVIAVTIDSSTGITTLAVDGQSFHTLHQGQEIRVRRDDAYPIYVMPGLDPYRRLRSRLGWGSEEPERMPRGAASSRPSPADDGEQGVL